MTTADAVLPPSYLSDCAIFAKVAETLSYQVASKQLGMTRSTVSKRIKALEQVLGVMLLNRSTHRISLTDAGANLLAHWTDIERAARASFGAVHGSDLAPAGSLRVSIGSSLGALLMPCLVRTFLQEWPDIQLRLDFCEPFVDVVGKGYDAVIRIAEELNDSVLIAKRLATSQRMLAASPSYLEQRGCPTSLRSLKEHHVLGLHGSAEHRKVWRFIHEGKVKETTLAPVFVANNDLALILAACLDVGILYTPKILIESELHRGHLKIIELNDAEGPEVGVFALYPHRDPPAKVRVFVDFVGKQLEKLDHLDRWRPLAE